MEIIVHFYDVTIATKLNRCCIFSHVISTADLFVYNSNNIHPAYLEGSHPHSRHSIISWPLIPRPPQSYWRLCSQFISKKLLPLMAPSGIPWSQLSPWCFSPFFFKHTLSLNLYSFEGDTTCYKMKPKARSTLHAIYTNVPYQCSVSFNEEYFFPVDMHSHSKGLSVGWKWFTPPPRNISHAQTLTEAFDNHHPSLKQICGKIHLPPDDGRMLGSTTRSQNSIFGASDASLKDGQASHAWVLSSGKTNDIMNPLMNISGSGRFMVLLNTCHHLEENSKALLPLQSLQRSSLNTSIPVPSLRLFVIIWARRHSVTFCHCVVNAMPILTYI